MEIGSEFGMSGSILASRHARIIDCIDLFPGDMLNIHQSNLEEAGLAERIRYHVGDSKRVDWEGPIGLLFIDGDHSYEGALADLKRWVPYVEMGGLIALHDVAQPTNLNPHPSHHEVARALRDFGVSLALGTDAEFVTYLQVDSMRVIRRVNWPTGPKT